MNINLRRRMAGSAGRGPNWPIGIILLCLWVLGLSACATLPQGSPEEIVTERAKARWAALLGKEVETAYGYYSPGYRSSVSLAQLQVKLAAQRVRWTGAEFLAIQCREAVCRPQFRIAYRYNMPLRGVGEVESSTTVTEEWVNTGDGWYFVPPALSDR